MKKKGFLILLCFVWFSPQSFAKEHSITDTKVVGEHLEGQSRQSKLKLVMKIRVELKSLEAEQLEGQSRQSKLKLVMKIRGKNNNNPKEVAGKDLAIMKILARNLLGHQKLWSILFQKAPRMWMDEIRNAKKRKAHIVKLKRQLEELDSTVATVEQSDKVVYSEDEESVELAIPTYSSYEDSEIEVVDPVAEVNLETKVEKSTTPTTPTTTMTFTGPYSAIGIYTSGRDAYDYNHVFSVNTVIVEQGNTIGDVRRVTEEFKFYGVSSNVTVQTQIDTNYSYLALGEWNGDGRTLTNEHTGEVFNVDHGHYVFGLSTKSYPGGEIPKTGTATYNGSLRGDYITGGTISRNSIGGSITLNANFGSQTMSGNLSATRNGSAWASATFDGFSIDADAEFWGNLTVTGGGFGVLEGHLYGPNAEEIGGGFSINNPSGDLGSVSGVFRATTAPTTPAIAFQKKIWAMI